MNTHITYSVTYNKTVLYFRLHIQYGQETVKDCARLTLRGGWPYLQQSVGRR